MATDQTKVCAIVNNSGHDIVIAMASNEDEVSSADTVAAANGQLEILKPSSGNTVISNGGSDTVTLDRSYTAGSGENGYVPSYDLLICDSNWLYPLTQHSVVQQATNGSTGYGTQTIALTDNNMNSVVSFYQTIATYPDSQLAKNYMAAIQAANDAAIAKADGSYNSSTAIASAIADTMTRFFKSTQEYQQVTMADVVALDNYYNCFPAIWAQYRDNMTYYLYGSDGITTSFAGVLLLQKSGPIDISKTNGGYTCTFMPAVNSTNINKTDVDTSKGVTLTYANGLFVDDTNATIPAIGLKGTFLLKRLLTNDPQDTSVITLVAGTINSSTCIGLDTPQRSSDYVEQNLMATEDSSQNTIIQYWDRLIDPQSLKDWAVTILTFAGAILLIPAIAFAVYRIYKLVTYKPLTQQDVQNGLNAPVDTAIKQGVKWQGGDEEALAEYYGISVDIVTEITANAMISQALAGAFSIQRTYMAELLQYTTLLNGSDVKNLQSLLDQISASELAATKFIDETVYSQPDTLSERIEAMKLEMAKLPGYTESFNTIYKKIQQQVSTDSRETIEESASHVNTLITDLQKEMDKENQEETELDPIVEKKIEPEPI